MHSLHHSRGRILFEVACAFGIAASCVEAWMQTYATAMLAVAAIAALYGLVHAFDMLRRNPKADESVGAAELATDHREAQSAPAGDVRPEFTELPEERVAEAARKRSRKSPKQTGRRDKQEAEPGIAVTVAEARPDLAEAVIEPRPEIVEAAYQSEERAEPEPELHVVETESDEPEYVPATPLFEPEPFVRQQRAAFGRKARY